MHVILGRHEGGPDGMDFDSQGNLLVANWGSGYIDVSKLHKTSTRVVEFEKCPNNMGHQHSHVSNRHKANYTTVITNYSITKSHKYIYG